MRVDRQCLIPRIADSAFSGYDLQADTPPVLVPRARRHEVRERLRHDGRIEMPLDLAQVREAARALRVAGARSIAVCFLYCYGDPRKRDRALVRRDLAEGTISQAVARDAYGLTDRP